jgi:hydrogenase maturation protein HypF
VVSSKKNPTNVSIITLRIKIEGAVQGVGFRPFVYRLATELGLKGWVNNSASGVEMELEGESELLDQFKERLPVEKPSLAFIDKIDYADSTYHGYSDFTITHSDQTGRKQVLMLPDIAICPDCLKEIFDPSNRRYRYPFTNCTNCGPRYSIIEALPYDRPNTTMKAFAMCKRCREEYENPRDRRFHAQPNACPDCGPHLELLDIQGQVLASHDDALIQAAAAIRNGEIVALKGIGGFQLLVDARNDEAVQRLRQRKGRDEKPFALMYQSLAAIKSVYEVSEAEEQLLASYAAPIVILRHSEKSSQHLSFEVAPHNPNLGVMLPYTPLHHLLMKELGFPIVATSGNLSDEPICIDNAEALARLSGVADKFLVHNRGIVRHVDDSVARILAGEVTILRRARGYAPLPVKLPMVIKQTLAGGAHLKNTAAIAFDSKAFITQHIGDLDNDKAYAAYINAIKSLSDVYEFKPEQAIADKHPDYLSSKYAAALPVEHKAIQHHVAHIYSCLADNAVQPPALGVAWDGTGLGDDGTIWGGEFFLIKHNSYKRIAHLRTFNLPGGDKAIREPRRCAVAILYEILGDEAFALPDIAGMFNESELTIIKSMLTRRINSPVTSSAGRLFDAVSSLLAIRHFNNYEGQAAMELEFAIGNCQTVDYYPFDLRGNSPVIIDWEKTIRTILDDKKKLLSVGEIAAKFHNTLAEMIVETTRRSGESKVMLSGGCFQNKYLIEKAITRLREEGFKPYRHHQVPPNDGGISLGQIAAILYNESLR